MGWSWLETLLGGVPDIERLGGEGCPEMQTGFLLWAGRWGDMGGAFAGLWFLFSFSLLLDFELVLYLQVCI